MTSLLSPLADNEGTATLILPASDIPRVLISLPQGYRVLHSEQAEADGEIKLRVASTDLHGHLSRLTIEIDDAAARGLCGSFLPAGGDQQGGGGQNSGSDRLGDPRPPSEFTETNFKHKS
jgi:hypothetical protein